MTDIDHNLFPPKQFQIMNYSEHSFVAIGINHLNFFCTRTGIKTKRKYIRNRLGKWANSKTTNGLLKGRELCWGRYNEAFY